MPTCEIHDMSEVIGDASRRAATLGGNAEWPVVCDPTLAFVTPQLKATLDVWRRKRGQRLMPARADMTIQDLKFVLPHLAFVAVVREGERMRYKVRLMGSELDARVVPMTGLFVDEAVPLRFAEKWSATWGPAIETRSPFRVVGRVEFRDRRSTVSETLIAPLADDGEAPDVLMVAVYYHFFDAAEPAQAIAAQLIGELGEREAALGV